MADQGNGIAAVAKITYPKGGPSWLVFHQGQLDEVRANRPDRIRRDG